MYIIHHQITYTYLFFKNQSFFVCIPLVLTWSITLSKFINKYYINIIITNILCNKTHCGRCHVSVDNLRRQRRPDFASFEVTEHF
jgi:hypothetical protein